jgi:hypothetical protein
VTVLPLQQGNFVWCGFPEREAPLRPGALHVGYTLAVAAVAGGHDVMVAYTTSQPWPLLPGVIAFDSEEAAGLGQARAFVLDLRRLAYLPLTATWFPRVGEAGAGVLGRAPKALRDRVNATVAELPKRRPESPSRRGPLSGP